MKAGSHVVVSGHHPFQGETGVVVTACKVIPVVEFDSLKMPCPGKCGCEIPRRSSIYAEKLSPAQQGML